MSSKNKDKNEASSFSFESILGYPSPPYDYEDNNIYSPQTKRSMEDSNHITKKFKTLKEIFPNIYSKTYGTNLSQNATDLHSKCYDTNLLENAAEFSAYCLMCSTSVDEKNIHNHLYFGKLVCLDCDWEESTCERFSLNIKTPLPQYGFCNHINIKWDCNIINNFKNWFSHDEKVKFKPNLKAYLKDLKQINSLEPWRKAILVCEKFLSEKKRKKKIFENIDHPDDDRYLISKKAIEECPDCYTKLKLANFVFNTSNMLIHTTCEECDLLIYLVLDPPDGSQPVVKIL